MVWCNNIKIIEDWKFFTGNSRYYDQAALDDVYEVHEKVTFKFEAL